MDGMRVDFIRAELEESRAAVDAALQSPSFVEQIETISETLSAPYEMVKSFCLPATVEALGMRNI